MKKLFFKWTHCARYVFRVAKYHKKSGSTFLPCLGLPSNSHRENSISSIFLESPHQVGMKNFFGYFKALKTHRGEFKWQKNPITINQRQKDVLSTVTRVNNYHFGQTLDFSTKTPGQLKETTLAFF